MAVATTHLSQQPTAIYRGNALVNLIIPNNDTVSQSLDARGWCVFLLLVPSNFDGSALTVQVSVDDSTWYALYDANGVAVAPSVAAGQAYDLSGALAGAHYIRFISNTNQTPAATLTVMLKG